MLRKLLTFCLLSAVATAVGDESSDAAHIRRGQELIRLGRLRDAAAVLQQVPQESSLYPYAARGILYCAWQDTQADFNALVQPLLSSADADIARKARWAAAEHALMQGQQLKIDLETLRHDVEQQPELRPLWQLLGLDLLRLEGKFDKAIAEARRLEGDRRLTLALRHRIRLALAEVFYAREEQLRKAESASEQSADDEEVTEEEAAAPAIPRGQGEETLLHFIASNPESPLLSEAFRRLAQHDAFRNSATARERLREWAADSGKARRAALALLQLNALLNPEDAAERAVDASCANKALADYPREAETDTLLMEQARLLLARGESEAAALYLSRLNESAAASAQAAFLKACTLSDPLLRLKAFQELALRAPQQLQTPAWHNAVCAALQAEQEGAVEAILASPNISEDTRRELQALCAVYRMNRAPSSCRAVLEALKEQEMPVELRRDIMLDLAYLYPTGKSNALLDAMCPAELGDRQVLRYYALRERNIGSPEAVMRLMREAIAEVAGREAPESILCIHLSHLYSAADHHRLALRCLQHLIRRYPKGDYARRALYLAAHQAELIGTPAALDESMELYALCEAGGDSTAHHAALRRINILTRLGRYEEALQQAEKMLKRDKEYSAKDRALINAVRANAYAMEGSENGLTAAAKVVSETLELPDLPLRWRVASLLHRATLYNRLHREEEALTDNRSILSLRPDDMSALTDAARRDYYLAAAGIITRLLKEERADEAADIASQAAAWNPENEADISERFLEWAQYIRKSHFLPAE